MIIENRRYLLTSVIVMIQTILHLNKEIAAVSLYKLKDKIVATNFERIHLQVYLSVLLT